MGLGAARPPAGPDQRHLQASTEGTAESQRDEAYTIRRTGRFKLTHYRNLGLTGFRLVSAHRDGATARLSSAARGMRDERMLLLKLR
jgi:hypothetical protein